MIVRIEGNIIEKNPAFAVVDCQGVGYQLFITLHTFSQLPESGKCALHTAHIIREDAHLLYGFYSRAERDMFNMLISVSGVGASSANLILSYMTPTEAQLAIIEGDVTALKSVKGIGLKTAERIIVDLRGKLTKEELPAISSVEGNRLKDEALSALVMLGFNKSAAEKGLAKAMKENKDQESVEQLIKAVLKGA
jgi:Holliday junction DNA helicase RuvA